MYIFTQDESSESIAGSTYIFMFIIAILTIIISFLGCFFITSLILIRCSDCFYKYLYFDEEERTRLN